MRGVEWAEEAAEAQEAALCGRRNAGAAPLGDAGQEAIGTLRGRLGDVESGAAAGLAEHDGWRARLRRYADKDGRGNAPELEQAAGWGD